MQVHGINIGVCLDAICEIAQGFWYRESLKTLLLLILSCVRKNGRTFIFIVV